MSVSQMEEVAEARERVAEEERQRQAAEADLPEVEGRTAADRAEAVEGGESDPEELFPKGFLDGEERVTLKNLIKAGEPVEVTASLMTAEVPLRGGLVDPRKSGQALVSYEVMKYIPVPQRDGETGDKQVSGWKIRCQLRPTYVEAADAYYTREQILDLLEALDIESPGDSEEGRIIAEFFGD